MQDSLSKADTLSLVQGQPLVLDDSIPQSYIDRIDENYKAWFAARRDTVAYADSAALAAAAARAAAGRDGAARGFPRRGTRYAL